MLDFKEQFDLGYELSKFERDNNKIYKFIESCLGYKLHDNVYSIIHELNKKIITDYESTLSDVEDNKVGKLVSVYKRTVDCKLLDNYIWDCEAVAEFEQDLDIKIDNLDVDSYFKERTYKSPSTPSIDFLHNYCRLVMLNGRPLLIILPLEAELLLNASEVLGKKTIYGVDYTLLVEFVDKFCECHNGIALVFAYDNVSFHYHVKTDRLCSNENITLKLNKIDTIFECLKSGINVELLSALSFLNGWDSYLESYIISRENFYNTYIDSVIDLKIKSGSICTDSNPLFIEFKNTLLSILNHYKLEKDVKELYTVVLGSTVEIFEPTVSYSKRLNILNTWKNLISNSEDYNLIKVSYTGIDIFSDDVTYNWDISVFKDLPLLLFTVATVKYNTSVSYLVRKLTNYYALDSSAYKKPYEISTNIYSDGNLNKIRAVSKFVNAVEVLGFNLTDFDISVKRK